MHWSGVLADESDKRTGYARFSLGERDLSFLYNFLAIHKWTAADVFAFHKYFGIKPSPIRSTRKAPHVWMYDSCAEQ